MSRKQLLVSAVVIVLLGGLAYLQFRTWRDFDWRVFIEQTRHARPLNLLAAAALTYSVYFLRALRWKIFLRPARSVSATSLVAPTMIGFTALGILGRPGDFIRPYIIARKTALPFASQVAVWFVERAFDIGSFTTLVALDILLAPSLKTLPYFDGFRRGAVVLVAAVIGLAIFIALVRFRGSSIADWIERVLGRISRRSAHLLAHKVRAFGQGLNTIHDFISLLQLIGLSLAIWLVIAFSYVQVTHAYPEPLQHMTLSHVLLLMGFSIAGSTVQLPLVGGGSQLMTIGALAHVFDVPRELAVSCGMMLWFVTFLAVMPAGLLLARREHLSLSGLSQESHLAEEREEQQDSDAPSSPPVE